MKNILVFICLTLVLTACAGIGGPSVPTNFYVLKTSDNLTPPKGLVSLDTGLNVGIGPVQIPGYADRAQIVTFGTGSEITVADLDHWAEPLGDAIKRVLSGNVASLIGETRVFSYPADFRPDKQSIQIAVEIIDVAQLDNGEAYLSARWHVRRLFDNTVVLRSANTYKASSVAGNYDSYADALSGLLGRLAEDMAASLEKAKTS